DGIQIALQRPDGTFEDPKRLPTGVSPSDIALVDVDGDGLRDVVVSDQASGDVSVFLNDQAHSFTRTGRFRAGTGLFGLDPAGSPRGGKRSASPRAALRGAGTTWWWSTAAPTPSRCWPTTARAASATPRRGSPPPPATAS